MILRASQTALPALAILRSLRCVAALYGENKGARRDRTRRRQKLGTYLQKVGADGTAQLSSPPRICRCGASSPVGPASGRMVRHASCRQDGEGYRVARGKPPRQKPASHADCRAACAARHNKRRQPSRRLRARQARPHPARGQRKPVAAALSAQTRISRTTAAAAMPSPRPSKPRRSVVLPLTLTRSGATPRSAAIFSRICST